MSTISIIAILGGLGIVVCLTVKWHQIVHKKRLEAIANLLPNVETALAEISTYYCFSHYITESERLLITEKFSCLFKEVALIINTKELDNSPNKESFKRFYNAISASQNHKNVNNARFVECQLKENSSYFDNILTFPLDKQQREAIVSLEDNVLVISSAGSGKTMTAVGKVRYLVDVQKVSPERILLITFTRKAAESLSSRLGEDKIKCQTFHKLALDIIADATGEKPTIAGQDFSMQVYHDLYQDNKSFRLAVTDYVVRARYKMKDWFEYTSMQDYIHDRKKYGVQAYFKDMDGRPVFCKSDEECQICDFLGSRGIKFRYEEKYEVNTADSEYRQYCPDFSIYIDTPNGETKRVYLEHFAINEADHCPPYFGAEGERKYKMGISWKRQLHHRNGTVLLETTSAGFHIGNVFENLSKQLLKLGAVFNDIADKNLSRDLEKQEESLLNLLTSFNFLMKSRNISIKSINQQVEHTAYKSLVRDVLIPFMCTYKMREEEKDEIDFTDAIIRATDLCNNGHRPDYDYILVDEFQDISLDRYRFLQSLRNTEPLTKLFCVGDDWQSIYRFAGSDMALFKHFEEYFGYTKKCLMETTYRFGEPAIAKSSKFILTNPEQALKNVRSYKTNRETKLDFISTKDRSDMVQTVKNIIDHIPTDMDILLLGRYSFDINIFKETDVKIHDTKDQVYITYGNRKVRFMTVHQSKGLESDYIILLNCSGGTIGFPADIADNPVLKFVLSEPDGYVFGEERRVFYVGITRAKQQTWVLYDVNNPSIFIKEFIDINKDIARPEDIISGPDRCPICHCGRIVVVKKSVAVNGNPYSVQVCSNKKYGCDYHETVFVNINKRNGAHVNLA